MPTKTESQHTMMQMSRSAKGRARLRRYGTKPAPKKVAEEMVEADKKAGKFQGRKRKKKTRGELTSTKRQARKLRAIAHKKLGGKRRGR